MRTYWEPRKNEETKKEKIKAKGTVSEGFFLGPSHWLLLHEISRPKRYETKGGAIGNILGNTLRTQ
jgi:hypothetical protein